MVKLSSNFQGCSLHSSLDISLQVNPIFLKIFSATMVDSCWIWNLLNVETPTNHTWMKTRDFGDSEYGIFKVIEFIYIWLFAMFLCSYSDFNESRTTGTKIMKLWQNNTLSLNNCHTNFNVVASLVLEILAFILNSVDG